MSDNKFASPGGDDMSNTDKEYYEDLYNDLPKEVVDILMQTHPLMGKNENDLEATAYRSRRPQREDIEEIKEARMQKVGEEVQEIRRAPQQEGDPTRYVSRRGRTEETNKDDDYDDGIQYVSVMPAKKKSRIVEEITLQTSAPQKRKKTKQEEDPFQEFTMSAGRPRYEDIDFEEKAKQEHLNDLYDDDDYDDYDDERGVGFNRLTIILGVISLILIIFLIFKCVSLSGKLEEMENTVTTSADLTQRNSDLTLENARLQEQITQLQEQLSGSTPANSDNETQTPSENSDSQTNTNANSNTNSNTTTNGATKTYKIAAGDSLWSIAEKMLGNGARSQEILDLNNLTEAEAGRLSIGTEIKIPAQ